MTKGEGQTTAGQLDSKPQKQVLTIDDVRGLREALLQKVDLSTIDSFSFLLESKASFEGLNGKSDVGHKHSASDIRGLRRDENMLDTFQGLVTGLGKKADKDHAHHLKDLFSKQELIDLIRLITQPVFSFVISQKDDEIVFHAHLQSSNGYYMPGISLEFRKREHGKRNWTHVGSLGFQLGAYDYVMAIKDLDYSLTYDCEICVKDYLNPEYRGGSGVVTITPKKQTP